ncbi:MAG: cyanophycinase [Pirellula sp.]
MLCGGSVLPDSILDRFYELGGGAGGRLVIVPTASPRSDLAGSDVGAGGPDFSFWTDYWRRYRWESVEVVHVPASDFQDMDAWVARLERATAVWMAGGDQNRLSQRIRGTPVADALRRVLERGGVVAGTSAGAAICSETMISGGTRDPEFQLGFGWLTGTMIDQHFLAKRRRERLSKAVCLQPGRTGIGIDESTALVLAGSTAEVLGSGHVHFYAANPGATTSATAASGAPSGDGPSSDGDANAQPNNAAENKASSKPVGPSRSELPDLIWSGGSRIEIGRLGLFR